MQAQAQSAYCCRALCLGLAAQAGQQNGRRLPAGQVVAHVLCAGGHGPKKRPPAEMETLRRLATACLLHRRTYQNTAPYLPRIVHAKVVKVYDGDTLHLAYCTSWRRAQRIRVRLAGFDCAEMRSLVAAEKYVALRSKQRLEAQVLGRVVRLHQPLKWDKYGRLLADLATPSMPSIRDWMIQHGDGIPYDGGTKTRVDWQARV